MPHSVHLDEDNLTLYSRLSGVLTVAEVREWETSLYATSRRLAEGLRFQFVDDLRGYEVADQDHQVHQLVRSVTPTFLAAHGFVVGFWRLYEQLPPDPTEKAVCWRVAHLHHDCAKMERYTELLANDTERFFCDDAPAAAWVGETYRGVEADNAQQHFG